MCKIDCFVKSLFLMLSGFFIFSGFANAAVTVKINGDLPNGIWVCSACYKTDVSDWGCMRPIFLNSREKQCRIDIPNIKYIKAFSLGSSDYRCYTYKDVVELKRNDIVFRLQRKSEPAIASKRSTSPRRSIVEEYELKLEQPKAD